MSNTTAKMNYLAKFSAELLNSELAESRRVRGCSRAEVGRLEAELNVVFPEAYREFLLLAGQNAGDLFYGSEYRIGEVVDNQRVLVEECAAENMPITWPSDSFAFYAHHGYFFLLFRITNDPDPFVFSVEIGGDVVELGVRFSEFLQQALHANLEFVRGKWILQAISNRRLD